jgi:AbrB family looped-hinge helix DNA binding protein
MQTKVSTDGQVELPDTIRRELGLSAGDSLDAKVEDGRIVLTPQPPESRKFEARIITDPITGLPVLDTGPDAPVMTNEHVAEILADFP